MAKNPHRTKIIVGVDGSGASVAALRQAHSIATALEADMEAWSCWEFPAGYEGYLAMGIDGFAHEAEENLREAMKKAFGTELPGNVRTRLVRGHPRTTLIEGSKNASLLAVGRRGHGGFRDLLVGSVSSACVAHAHCPVLVVHTPEDNHDEA